MVWTIRCWTRAFQPLVLEEDDDDDEDKNCGNSRSNVMVGLSGTPPKGPNAVRINCTVGCACEDDDGNDASWLVVSVVVSIVVLLLVMVSIETLVEWAL